jgi:ABC-type uncharacterized transport system ATPase subunit
MREGVKIKVIKKGEIKEPVKVERKTKRAAAREMVSTVTTWVSDFQTRKRDETKLAIENFFGAQPQPMEP